MCTLKEQLRLGPLPAKKQLWEAPDAATWEAVRDEEPMAATACLALTVQGGLVQVDGIAYCDGLAESLQMPRYGEPTTNTTSTKAKSKQTSGHVPHWEDWCAQADELGELVMLSSLL